MLLLLFHAGSDVYAIDSAHVIEIIAKVHLQKAAHAPDAFAGLFQYRQAIVPVIDLCYLLTQQPSRPYLSTRIMIVRAPDAAGGEAMWGLMAERVTETIAVSTPDFTTSDPVNSTVPYLGTVIQHDQRLIQRLHPEGLPYQELIHGHRRLLPV